MINLIHSQQSLNYTLLAVGAAVFASFANILARTLLKGTSAKDILGINFLTMGITLVLISPLFYQFKPTYLTFILIGLIAAIDTVANYFYFKTFEQTEASVATPVLSLAPGFTFLFGWLVLGNVVSLQTYLLAGLIIVGTVFFSIDFKNFDKFKAATLKPALISSFLFGLSAIPTQILLKNLHAINAPTLYMFRAGFIALFALLFFNFNIQQITSKQFRIIFFRGLVVITQYLLLYSALTIGNAGVAVTLGNITPIFVFVLSVIFLREKPTLKKILTAALILILSIII